MWHYLPCFYKLKIEFYHMTYINYDSLYDTINHMWAESAIFSETRLVLSTEALEVTYYDRTLALYSVAGLDNRC